MPGFILSIDNCPIEFAPETRTKLITSSIIGSGYKIERRVVNKFMDDRIFVDRDDYVIISEGVVLNRRNLINKYAEGGDFEKCIVNMYKLLGDSFFNEFRGSFSGVFYDKQKSKWLAYTNHIGDKQVFYTKTKNGYLIASEIGFIVDCLKANGGALSIDETACYMTLTHGFCLEDSTLVKEVRKLTAGHYLRVEDGKLAIIEYHRFHNTPDTNICEADAIEGIDRLFRQAIKRQFEKDREYGYQHLTCLSGGLDSRMTVWVAHDMGYTEQLNITFAESGCLDFSLAQQIATDLHHDWLYKPLDGGDCVKLIDDVTKITYGSANFFGLANGKGMEDLINYDRYGIIHTGQIGDAIIGTFFKKNEYNPEYKLGQGAYSLELIERLDGYNFSEEYDNEEIFCLYSRAFNCADQGLLTFQENSESYSPFTDVDFLEFCYKIPLNLRYNHKIYFDWILQKYPGAAKYAWEKTGQIIKPIQNTPPRYMGILGKRIPAFTDQAFPSWLKGSILRRLGIRKKGEKRKTATFTQKASMTPIDYWYANNPNLRRFMNDYWSCHKHYVEGTLLGDDMRHLFEDCVVFDKMQALTVIAAINLIKG